MAGLKGPEERDLAALFSAAQAGDSAAYGALLTGLLPGLRARLAGDEARAQMALLRLHRLRATWRPGRPIGVWASLIAEPVPAPALLWRPVSRFFARRTGKAPAARV